jgi:hypothetical protein
MWARDRREAKPVQPRHRGQSATASAFFDQILYAETFGPFDLLSDFFDLVKDVFKIGRWPGWTEHGGQFCCDA